MVSTPELTDSVWKAGGLGFLAGGYDVSKLQDSLANAQKPCGVGVFGYSPPESLTSLFCDQELSSKIIAFWIFAGSGEQITDWITKIHNLKPEAKIFVQVNSTKEAKLSIAAGCDAIVAQGSDAGGHGQSNLSLISLLPSISDYIATLKDRKVALFAAGGITDRRTALAAQVLAGDDTKVGLVLGTILAISPESSLSNFAREQVVSVTHDGENTCRSRQFDKIRGTDVWPKEYDGRALTSALTGNGIPVVWSSAGVGQIKSARHANEVVAEFLTYLR